MKTFRWGGIRAFCEKYNFALNGGQAYTIFIKRVLHWFLFLGQPGHYHNYWNSWEPESNGEHSRRNCTTLLDPATKFIRKENRGVRKVGDRLLTANIASYFITVVPTSIAAGTRHRRTPAPAVPATERTKVSRTPSEYIRKTCQMVSTAKYYLKG